MSWYFYERVLYKRKLCAKLERGWSDGVENAVTAYKEMIVPVAWNITIGFDRGLLSSKGYRATTDTEIVEQF